MLKLCLFDNFKTIFQRIVSYFSSSAKLFWDFITVSAFLAEYSKCCPNLICNPWFMKGKCVQFKFQFVGDFERLVVLRLGRAQKTRGPGATVVLPCIDTYTKVDVRVNAFNVPPMQIITIDRGLVELGATVFLQVRQRLLYSLSLLKPRNHHRLSSFQRNDTS